MDLLLNIVGKFWLIFATSYIKVLQLLSRFSVEALVHIVKADVAFAVIVGIFLTFWRCGLFALFEGQIENLIYLKLVGASIIFLCTKSGRLLIVDASISVIGLLLIILKYCDSILPVLQSDSVNIPISIVILVSRVSNLSGI